MAGDGQRAVAQSEGNDQAEPREAGVRASPGVLGLLLLTFALFTAAVFALFEVRSDAFEVRGRGRSGGRDVPMDGRARSAMLGEVIVREDAEVEWFRPRRLSDNLELHAVRVLVYGRGVGASLADSWHFACGLEGMGLGTMFKANDLRVKKGQLVTFIAYVVPKRPGPSFVSGVELSYRQGLAKRNQSIDVESLTFEAVTLPSTSRFRDALLCEVPKERIA